MKKLLPALAVGSLCVMPMMGETYHTKGYGVMQTNDIYTVTVGPGTVETKTVLKFSTNASNNLEDINAQTTVNILKVDLTNEYVTPKVAFADKYKIQDVTKTIPQMMSAETSYAKHYFAGVNGDFFGYITCGVTVADGKYVYAGNFLNDNTPFEGNHFIIDKDGLPYIADHVEFGCNLGIRNGYSGENGAFGEVTFPDGTTYDEMRYNAKDRWDNYLVLCSPYVNRTSTGFNIWGTEVELRNAGNQTMFGAAGEFKVGKKTLSGTGGNMAIPADGYVLSGTGSRNFNDKVNTGDKVRISIPFKADGVDNSCRETVGGWPRLVTNGTPIASVPSQTPSDLGGTSRRARTAVGFSQDRKTLYIVVLDEGKTRNQGMTFKALGNFMEAIGCYNAMNLDGGGSSVLHVENLGQRSAVQGVENGYNRPVMNGLFLVTNAPENRKIASIEIVDKALTIKPGRGYVPTIYGYNKYGVLVCTNVTDFTLSATDDAVKFNSGNRKMVAPASGEFTLTAKCGNATYSIPVKVSAAGIDGVDAATEAKFAEQVMTPIPPKPANWDGVEDDDDDDDPSGDDDDAVKPILEDVTPIGYDFSRYEAGTQFKVHDGQGGNASHACWSPMAGIYDPAAVAADGHFTSYCYRGVAADNTPEKIAAANAGITIQDFGGYLGKCLVINQAYGPLASDIGAKNDIYGEGNAPWPQMTTGGAASHCITFYCDKDSVQHDWAGKAIRVRLVFNVLYRGCHKNSKGKDNGLIDAYAFSDILAADNEGTAGGWYCPGTEYVNDALIPSAAVRANGSEFGRWENEGTCLAEMPAEPKLLMSTELDPLDNWNHTNSESTPHYLMQLDRFMVYEWDTYMAGPNQNLKVNIDFDNSNMTIVIKEIKFFNITNARDLLVFKENSSDFTYGPNSLLEKRQKSWRYYTEKGVEEFAEAGENNAGMEEVIDNDENAPVEYYNLQGIRVNNPSNGIFIRRQGNTVSKVLIK